MKRGGSAESRVFGSLVLSPCAGEEHREGLGITAAKAGGSHFEGAAAAQDVKRDQPNYH